jgi:hypothetical protein
MAPPTNREDEVGLAPHAQTLAAQQIRHYNVKPFAHKCELQRNDLLEEEVGSQG